MLTESYLEQPGLQGTANEEDIVVDAIDIVVTNSDRDFVTNPGQILGLDQAVLQSIDRCRKYNLVYQNILFFILFYLLPFLYKVHQEIRMFFLLLQYFLFLLTKVISMHLLFKW